MPALAIPTLFPAIQNACDRPLFGAGAPTMPNVRDTLLDRMSTLRFIRIVKNIVDFQTTESELPITLTGQWTNLSARQLAIKPEGQRRWKWKQLIATADFGLAPDDEISKDGVRFRCMAVFAWENEGVIAYDLVEDYQKGGTP